MKPLIILLLIFVLNIFLVNATVYYEDGPDYIRIYNDVEVYCINKTTGLQFGIAENGNCKENLFNKNELCGEGVRPSGYFRYCFEQLPYDTYNIFQNNDYVNVSFYKMFGTPTNNIEFTLTYQLKNQTYDKPDGKLYIDFRTTNNVQGNNKIHSNVSFVIKDISTEFTAVEFNNTKFNINDVYQISNPASDGITVRANNKYFGLNYDFNVNTSIYLNKNINITQDSGLINNGDSSTLSFTYFDPVGDCASIFDVVNGSLACYGNQWHFLSADSGNIGAGQKEKVAFRFQVDGAMNVSSLSYCVASKTAGNPALNQVYIGIQSNGFGAPSGIWVDNQTITSFSVGCNTLTMPNFKELTANSVYWVVIDGVDHPAGADSIAIGFSNPFILREPYRFVYETWNLVRKYSASKWVTDTDGTPLFSIFGNSSDTNEKVEIGKGITYHGQTSFVNYGTLGQAQVFVMPFNFTAYKLGLHISGSSTNAPPEKLHYVIERVSDGFGLAGGDAVNNNQEFNNTVERWEVTNLTNPLNFTANQSYRVWFFCSSCSGLSYYKIMTNYEDNGMNLAGNNSFMSINTRSQYTFSNGSSFSDYVYPSGDLGFYFLGNATPYEPPEPPTPAIIATGLQIISSKFDFYPQNSTRIISIQVYNDTNLLNNYTCSFYLYNQYTNGSLIYSTTNATVSDNVMTITVPTYSFNDKGQYEYSLLCNTTVQAGHFSNKFIISGNGDKPASNYMTIFIWVWFILITMLSIISFFGMMVRAFNLTLDLQDVGIGLTIFSLIVLLYYVAKSYLTSNFIANFINYSLYVFGFGLFVFPLTMVLVSFIVKKFLKKA